MIQRFYFDTSVFGGVFDEGFEEASILLFERVKLGHILCVYSNLTESELSNAPAKVQNFFIDLDDSCKQLISVSPDALKLAQTYI